MHAETSCLSALKSPSSVPPPPLFWGTAWALPSPTSSPGWREVEAQPLHFLRPKPTAFRPWTCLPQRLQPTLLLATLSAAFGSAFQYGYNLSVVNTPHKVGTRWTGQQLTVVVGGS